MRIGFCGGLRLYKSGPGAKMAKNSAPMGNIHNNIQAARMTPIYDAPSKNVNKLDRQA